MMVKIKILNPIGENSDLVEDFWTQMNLERKFHTEVIETFQRQCVDEVILDEKHLINYVTVMGMKSVLDNGISNYEIYKQVRYEIINHIGNDLKRLENHFRNVIEKIIQIIKIKPWPYQEFMNHVFKINDLRFWFPSLA